MTSSTADLFILIGGNPASNHPRLLRSLMSLRRRGGNVIVINPAKEVGLVSFRVPSDPRSLLFGTAIASEYVQPHIGGDVALLTGIARLVLDRGGCDHGFISQHTEGFEAFRTQIETIDWEAIESASGVDRRTMARVADMYISAQNVVIGWTMGITHHLNGVDNVQVIANLALLRGHGRTPARRSPADPRPQQRPGHRHRRGDARAEAGGPDSPRGPSRPAGTRLTGP